MVQLVVVAGERPDRPNGHPVAGRFEIGLACLVQVGMGDVEIPDGVVEKNRSIATAPDDDSGDDEHDHDHRDVPLVRNCPGRQERPDERDQYADDGGT